MAAPTENMLDQENKLFCNIEATVATGFELVAKEEAEEKCGSVTKVSRGNINIRVPVENAEKVLSLRGVDNCRVVLDHVPHFGFSQDQDDNLLRLRQLVGKVDWPHGLNVWRRFFSFEHPVADVPEVITDDFGEVTHPPPRQKTEGKSSSKRSRKNRKRKGKATNQIETIANNTEELNKELQESKDETNVVGTDTDRLGNEQETAYKTTETKVLDDSVAKSKGSDAETLQQEKLQVSDSACDKKEETEGKDTALKKPRIRENPWDPLKPAFRVTCNRVGDNHNFDSMSAAANFGGAIYRYFGWNVEMKNFDIEVMLNIEEEEVTVCIGLTRESLHRRNIDHFGPTTLRPTLAYNMLRLCEIKTGYVVCDPMCGSGSIPVESSLNWPYSYNLCGDISKKCVWRTNDNLQFMKEEREKANQKPLEVDVVKWDVCNLPLRSHSVDVFITDLPFGVRSGSKVNNWTLYPNALMEMARVVRPVTGRVCLLTQDKKCMIQTLQSCSRYWTRTKTLGINIGGLAAGVFVLYRKSISESIQTESTPSGMETTPKTIEQPSSPKT